MFPTISVSIDDLTTTNFEERRKKIEEAVFPKKQTLGGKLE